VPGLTLTFALLAGVAMATYSVFSRLGSAGIHPALGAVVVTGVAFVVNVVIAVTSSFVIGATSAGLVLLVGFLLLREPFSWTKVLAIGLIVGGIFLLQREGL
jgi:drug/metabolite transporter (DMT)-like permease